MAREDCTFDTEEGRFNYRVAAYICMDGKILMAHNPNEPREFYYSVGGRVYFGETMEEAVEREVREETGFVCKAERLIAVHENFFVTDQGVPYHEVSMFYKMKPNDELGKVTDGQLTDQGPQGEDLRWIDLNDREGITIYPIFFTEPGFGDGDEVMHFVTKDGVTYRRF